MKHSVGVTLASRIAADEAAHGNWNEVQPEHLIIGLCSLEKLLNHSGAPIPDVHGQVHRAIRAESEAVQDLLARFNMEPQTLRRHMRRNKANRNFKRDGRIITHSQRSLAVFQRAAELATARQADEIDCSCLMTTLLEDAFRPLEALSALHGTRVAIKCLATLNYSLVHADVPFVSSIEVINDGLLPVRAAELRITLADYAASGSMPIEEVPPQSRRIVKATPKFQFDHHHLRDLAEPVKVPLQAWIDGARIPLTFPLEVALLPPVAWNCEAFAEALAGFVMPQTNAIREIVNRSTFELRRLVGDAEGFVDLSESLDPDAAEKTLQALYFCLQERYGIRYEYEPRTYAPEWQIVRFHDQVIDQLQGTCIDLSLLLAACLESVHRDPLIALVKIHDNPTTGEVIHHAVIGCWRTQCPPGAPPVVWDGEDFLRCVRNGEILVLDSKGFPKTKEFRSGMPYADCRKAGNNYVERYPLVYAIDIRAAREAGYAPMALGSGGQFDRPAWVAVFRARLEAERLSSPAVGARHLLLGLLGLPDSLLGRALLLFGPGKPAEAARIAETSLPRGLATGRCRRETADWRAVMSQAGKLAKQRAALTIHEADLAMALACTPTQAGRVLDSLGISIDQFRQALLTVCNVAIVASEWHSSSSADENPASPDG